LSLLARLLSEQPPDRVVQTGPRLSGRVRRWCLPGSLLLLPWTPAVLLSVHLGAEG